MSPNENVTSRCVESHSHQHPIAANFRQFVQRFLSDKLVLPPDFNIEHPFTVADLRNDGEIGRGRFGIVFKMTYIPTQQQMAVKVR